ncbi:hypothetical protein F2Q69_00035829 [Brassica cretica]|uniref:Uncharacterized protein n=1 Tax=Brassica cretica TaxID=69181 RepID=A0A8S9SQZ7_BRACR|nr:hypothetical protein F2Q69_00035829 [Brassica cretica]
MWRAERAHSARPTATWITPRASLSSLDRTSFRFVSIGLSVEIYDENKSARRIETLRISSLCGELRGLIQLALRRPGSPLDLLSPVSIVQLFISSRSDFPLRFYDENKSARRIETVRISSPCGELRELTQLAQW